MSELDPAREGEAARQDRPRKSVLRRMGGLALRDAPDTVAFKEVLSVLRRHIWLLLGVVACTTGGAAFLAFRDPPVYRATATVRFSEGLRNLTADIDESPVPMPQRTIDPVLSLSEHLKSREVVSTVVDTIGSRLSSLTPDFSLHDLEQLRVDPRAPSDTLLLRLNRQEVVAQTRQQAVRAHYGELMVLGGVQFAVRADSANHLQEVVLALSPREAEIDRVLAGIEVVERQSTDVIDVSYSASDPVMAQKIVNAVVKTFQSLNIRVAQEQSRLRRLFLTEQVRQTDSLLASAQARLAAFRSRQQLANSSDRLAAAQTAMVALDAQREQLVADRRSFGELPNLLNSPDDSASGEALRTLAFSPQMASNPAVAKLSQQLVDDRTRLDSLRWKSAATDPDLAQLSAAIRSTKQELLRAVWSQINALDARIDALAGIKARSGASMQVLPTLEAEEMRLEARVDALRTLGDHLSQEAQKARLAEAAEVGDMQIMDLAGVPYSSTWPAGWLKIAIGLLAGLFLGGVGTFVLEANNTSIRRPEELEEVLQLPGLAIIPRVRMNRRSWAVGVLFRFWPRNGHGGHRFHRRSSAAWFRGRRRRRSKPIPRLTPVAKGLVALAQPHSIGTEAFRMLRTSLLGLERGRRLKIVVVTSVAPHEGKTVTSANLAVILARAGMQVLLVDGDLRRARLHKIFPMPRGPGLIELIRSYGAAKNGASNGHAVQPAVSEHYGSALPAAVTGTAPVAEPAKMRCAHSYIQPTGLDGLFLLPAGMRSNSSETLSEAQVSSDTFKETQLRRLLRELSHGFDIVIVDASPVLASADAAILASSADGVLFVVRAGRTGRAAVHHAYQQLVKVGAQVVGTVLNDPQGVLKQTEDYYYPYEYAEAKD
jgi:succinoglycan biosynthesis transport protein ExoP